MRLRRLRLDCPNASSGLVVGLQGLYWGAVLSATGEPHGAYDRSGRMFVGCFFRDRTGQVGLRRSICRDAEEFCGIYNRKDADAMAAAFAEGGIRVKPSGIFQVVTSP